MFRKVDIALTMEKVHTLAAAIAEQKKKNDARKLLADWMAKGDPVYWKAEYDNSKKENWEEPRWKETNWTDPLAPLDHDGCRCCDNNNNGGEEESILWAKEEERQAKEETESRAKAKELVERRVMEEVVAAQKKEDDKVGESKADDEKEAKEADDESDEDETERTIKEKAEDLIEYLDNARQGRGTSQAHAIRMCMHPEMRQSTAKLYDHAFVFVEDEAPDWAKAKLDDEDGTLLPDVLYLEAMMPYEFLKLFNDTYLSSVIDMCRLNAFSGQRFSVLYYNYAKGRVKKEWKTKTEEDAAKEAEQEEAKHFSLSRLRLYVEIVWAAFALGLRGIVVQPCGLGIVKALWLDTSFFARVGKKVPRSFNMIPFICDRISPDCDDIDIAYANVVNEAEVQMMRKAYEDALLEYDIVPPKKLCRYAIAIYCRTEPLFELVSYALEPLVLMGDAETAVHRWPSEMFRVLLEEIEFLKRQESPFERVIVSVHYNCLGQKDERGKIRSMPILPPSFCDYEQQKKIKWQPIPSWHYVCAICYRGASKGCPCLRSLYCSRRCQAIDWPDHKRVCWKRKGQQ